MTGFAYRIDNGHAAPIPIREAVEAKARLVWVHLETNDAVAQRWLRDAAHLGDYVIDALTATETSPRCSAFSGRGWDRRVAFACAIPSTASAPTRSSARATVPRVGSR